MSDQNPFKAIKKPKARRGQGMATSPKLGSATPVVSVQQPEHSPAAIVSGSARRTFRVSTFVSEEAGERLEDLITEIRRREGKKPKIAEVLEQALLALEKTL